MTITIELNDLTNLQNETTAITLLNQNSETIEGGFTTALNTTGDQMLGTLDMNSNQIVNLPSPATAQSPLRLTDLNTFIGGGTITNIPSGGVTGEALVKKSNANYDTEWSPNTADITSGTNIVTSGANPTVISTSTSPNFQTLTVTSAYVGSSGGIGGGVFITHLGTNENLSIQANLNATSGFAITSIKDDNTTLAAVELNASQVYLSSTTPLAALGGITTTNITASTITATTVTAAVPAGTLTGTTLASGVIVSSLTSLGVVTSLTAGTVTVTGNLTATGNITGVTGNITSLTAGAATITGTVTSAGIIFSGTTGIAGVTGGVNSITGNVGEYVSTTINSSASGVLTSGVPVTIASIVLTSGDWDVVGSIGFSGSAATNVTYFQGSINTVSSTMAGAPLNVGIPVSGTPFANITQLCVLVPAVRASLSASTTYYLVGQAGFSIGPLNAFGNINARRRR